MSKGNYYGGEWHLANGRSFESVSPVDSSVVWNGKASSSDDLDMCIKSACNAKYDWANTSIEERYMFVRKFSQLIKERVDELAKIISLEVGKPLWEAKTEALALAGKVEPTINAFEYRNKELVREMPNGMLSRTSFKPLGVVATISPYNFPAHMANGHIIAALVCGNCVIWKPSERCPMTAEKVMETWREVGLPDGVINMVQGGGDVGEYFCKDDRINGIFFTGSYYVGNKIRTLCDTGKMCALEMGGDSPLVIWDVSDLDAAVIATVQSSFITSGQRCSSARRLIVQNNDEGRLFIKKLIDYVTRIKVGNPFDDNQPYMGPMKDKQFVESLLAYQDELVGLGAKELIKCKQLDLGECYVNPGLIDVTPIIGKYTNKEVVGPFLRVAMVDTFKDAIDEANNTEYGLAAGIFTDKKDLYDEFYKNVKAGLINWNQQLTGASGMAPFGGVKKSGNFRPSGYFAVDYCVYAVAAIENERIQIPKSLPIGID